MRRARLDQGWPGLNPHWLAHASSALPQACSF
jgi:hypothetical protein